MTDRLRLDLGASGAALLLVVLVAAGYAWFRWSRRDAMWAHETPGERPRDGRGPTRRVRGLTGEWTGTVAVRFTPPDGVTPGIAGTVVDGRADHVDISATIIDLAVRGHLTLAAVRSPHDPATASVPADGGHSSAALDWRLTRHASDDPLRPYEAQLLADLFAHGDEVLLSSLRDDFLMTMRRTQIGLYREVVDHGWYRRHPQSPNRAIGCLGMLLAPLGLAAAFLGLGAVVDRDGDWPVLLPGLALVAGGWVLARNGRGRTPRTADGTAVRVQTLGFREYLATAEAERIRVDEASDVFSRYLPYAIVFGCAQRWSRLFGEVAAQHHLAGVGDAAFDLDWFEGVRVLADLADLGSDVVHVVDAFDGPGLLDVGDALGDVPGLDLVDVLGNGLGDLASGLGDFVSSVGDLLDGLGGCLEGCDVLDGCSGCDLGF